MKKVLFLLCALFLFSVSPLCAANKYQITQKFSFNDDGKLIEGINDEGECIGWLYEHSYCLRGSTMTLFRSKEANYQLASFSSKRGPKAPYPAMWIATNQQGQVAFSQATIEKRFGFNNYTFDTQLALWNSGEEPLILGSPEGWVHFAVVSINNKGQILMNRVELEGKPNEPSVAYWREGQFYLIPPAFMFDAVHFTDDGFIYGHQRENSVRIPVVYNIKNKEITYLDCPANTSLTFVNNKHEYLGVVWDSGKPVAGIMGSKSSNFKLLPADFFPKKCHSIGQIFGYNSQKELLVLELEKNEITNINENIIDENGQNVKLGKVLVQDVNNKGEIIVHASEFRLRALGRTAVSYLLTPVETP